MATSLPPVDFDRVGPAVGEPFPDIVLPDQDGRTVDLHRAREGRRALVVFYRSARWWPFCKTQLVELQRAAPDYQRNGIALFAISYDPVDVLAAFAAEHRITYPLLSDQGSQVIRRLGLLNEHVFEQHAFYGVPPRDEHLGTPYPGSFVLDERGFVVEKRFHQSYRERETGIGTLEDAFGAEAHGGGPVVASVAGPVRLHAHLDSPTYRFFQRLRLTVDLVLAPEIHIYGQPIPAGYVPLTLEIRPVEGVTVGPVHLPPTRPFRIEGLDEQFHVYEGRVRLSEPLTFPAEGPDLTIGGRVSYQACSTTACWPPAAWEFSLPLVADDLVGRPRKRN